MNETDLAQLAKFIAFETTADKPEKKWECLMWVRDRWLNAPGGEFVDGAIEDCPYLYLRRNDAKLLWFAHIDVVPGVPEQFSLSISGDRAFGRGVKDMKGGALAFLIAYHDACSNGEVPPINVLLTSDEEIAGPTISRLAEDGVIAGPVALTPDSGSKDQIVVEQKGMVWARLLASGRGGHGASPWAADNPNRKLVDAIVGLSKAFPVGADDDWRVTVEVTKFLGTTDDDRIDSQIVGDAGCCLDIRFPPAVAMGDLLAQIRRLLPEDCHLRIMKKAGPVQTSLNAPLVRRLSQFALEVTGTEVPIGREHGTSDARFLAEHGIPSVIFGPVGGGLHASNEWISISSLHHHIEINRRLIADFRSCSQK